MSKKLNLISKRPIALIALWAFLFSSAASANFTLRPQPINERKSANQPQPSTGRRFTHTAKQVFGALIEARSRPDSEAAKRLKALYGERDFPGQLERYIALVARFIEYYGEGSSIEILHGPARINILGEHVDYVSYIPGMVLPFGSREYDMLMAVAPRRDKLVSLRSVQEGRGEGDLLIRPEKFDISQAPRRGKDKWLEYLDTEIKTPPLNWANYVKGSCFYLQNSRPELDLNGMNVLVDSRIPISGGVSSSSALTTLGLYAVSLANGVEVNTHTLGEDASLAEYFVGSRGGSMDQKTISKAQLGKALQIIFKTNEFRPVDVPDGYCWITFYTGTHAGGSQVTSEYNARSAISRFVIPEMLQDNSIWNRFGDKQLRERWEKIVIALGEGNLSVLERPSVTADIEAVLNLLDEKLTLDEISKRYQGAYHSILKGPYEALFKHKGQEGLEIRSRARHHIYEVIRVWKAARFLGQAAAAKRSGDALTCEKYMNELGKLINECHGSLRDLYGLSTPRLEQVRNIALGQTGVLGSRLMGGGFGGSVLVLVKEETADGLIAAVKAQFYNTVKDPHLTGEIGSDILVNTPGRGACVVALTPQTRVLTSDPVAADVLGKAGSQELPLVVIGDHPDDIEGVTASFQRRAIRDGRGNIHWLVMTSGAGSRGVLDEQIPGYERLNNPQLEDAKSRMRQGETKRAAAFIGVPSDKIKFFGFGVGTAGEEDFTKVMGPKQESEFIDYLESIAESLPDGAPLAIAWHIEQDRHPSHAYSARFINSAVAKFMKETGRPVYAVRFRLWLGDRAQEKPNAYIVIDEQEADIKVNEILACHESQIERRRIQKRLTETGEVNSILTESRDNDEGNFKIARAAFPQENLAAFSCAEQFEIYKVELSDLLAKVLTERISEEGHKATQILQEYGVEEKEEVSLVTRVMTAIANNRDLNTTKKLVAISNLIAILEEAKDPAAISALQLIADDGRQIRLINQTAHAALDKLKGARGLLCAI